MDKAQNKKHYETEVQNEWEPSEQMKMKNTDQNEICNTLHRKFSYIHTSAEQ